MSFVNLKAELGETVYCVRKAAPAEATVQITQSEVHCIELLKERTTYILKSGHHCSEDELVALGYPHLLMAKVQEVLGEK